MKRVVKNPVVRKHELVEIALKQFLHYGYEKTSVRSILKEANGEIGMFYHYFGSKEEIYKEAIKLFNENFIAELENISTINDLSFIEKINMMFLQTQKSLAEYSNLKTDTLDPEILSALHRTTLLAMVPFCENILANEKNITLPDVNLRCLSEFVLFGISSIIHDENFDFKYKIEQIHKILFHLMEL